MNTTFAAAELGFSYLLKPDADPPASRTLNQITWNFTEMSAQDPSGNAEHWRKTGAHKTIFFSLQSFFQR